MNKIKKILAIIACSFALILTLGAIDNAYASQVKPASEVRADEAEDEAMQSDPQVPPAEGAPAQATVAEALPPADAVPVQEPEEGAYPVYPVSPVDPEVMNVLVDGVYTDVTNVWINPQENRTYYGTTLDGIPVYSYDSINWYEGTPESN